MKPQNHQSFSKPSFRNYLLNHTFTFLFFVSSGILAVSCQQEKPKENTEVNPAAEGFNSVDSDSAAIKIADEVMEAMGGREAWDTTRYLAWDFFGFRQLIWDKNTGDVRIDVPGDSSTYLINIKNDVGKVMKGGEEITNEDTLKQLVQAGKEMWINDSYWLIMPFKLKDSGVTLKYVGEDTTHGGVNTDVLELRFKNVGVTPDNKYDVYVDKQKHLVIQWAYYKEATADSPNFVTPWDGYKEYGNILLAGGRGQRSISNIKVMETVPANTFTSFDSNSI